MRAAMQAAPLKLGLYRTIDPIVGECARTHWRAGDGHPYLTREVYEAAQFQPPFDTLPVQDDYERQHPTQAIGPTG